MGWLRCSRASSASDPLASRKPVNSFKQSDTAPFQPHTPTQRHVRPQPGIQAAHPDRLPPDSPRAQCPTSQPARVETYRRCVLHTPTAPCYSHMTPRYRGDAACCVSTQRPCNRTTSMSPDHKILLGRRTALRRVQRSKAGGCQPRKAIPDAPSKPKPSQSRHARPRRIGVKEPC